MNVDIRYIDSVVGTHFTEALSENAIELESLDFPDDWRKIELHECIIENITIQSKQNFEWDVWVFSSSSGPGSDLDVDSYVDGFNYPKTAGIQIGGAGQYYYSSPSNHVAVPFRDENNRAKIHVGLINRSAAAKYAGVTGEVKVRLMVRGVYGV